MEVVREHFAPEFLNRVDDIILFNRLSRDNMNYILDLQIESIPSFLYCSFFLLHILIDTYFY